MDEKLLMVLADKLYPFYKDVESYTELPKILLDQVAHFFEHYKDLGEGKWVKIKGWDEPQKAAALVEEVMAAEAARK